MSDVLTERLARLAPEIDVGASRELFERRRDGGGAGSPRRRPWLIAAAIALLLGGVVGLFAIARNDGAVTPADQSTVPGDTVARPPATGSEFEVLGVEQIDAPFHRLFIVDDRPAYDAAMSELDPGLDRPVVDFDRHVAVVLTRPDNACPDALARFELDGSTWSPAFEPETTGCDEPLLSWLYVIGIDRATVAPTLTVTIAADERFDAAGASATATVSPPSGDPVGVTDPVALAETGIAVPLPTVGDPQLHATQVGFLWVVQHDDGSASVLPAVVDTAPAGDDGSVAGLGSRVIASRDGATFSGPRWEWDAWGRTIAGPRSEDLTGYVGEVRGAEVAILTSTARRMEGVPVVPADERAYGTSIDSVVAELGPPLDLDVYPTLSSIGPRFLDATLVIENGLGTICRVDEPVPVPELPTCGDDVTIETLVTSTEPGITSWYFGPLLVEFESVGLASRVVPLGGSASRNDAPEAFDAVAIEVIIEEATIECRLGRAPIARIELIAGSDTAVNVVVEADGGVVGRGDAEPLDGVVTDVEIELDLRPTSRWTVRVLAADHGSDEITSASFDPPDPGDC